MSGLTLFGEQNLSHAQRRESFEAAKQILAEKIEKRGDLPYISIEKQLELLDQLSEFKLGQFLIERGVLNGYWTHYVISYPEKKEESEFKNLNSLEYFLLNTTPVGLATQQRFQIFKSQIQRRIREKCSFASIPCGLMGDLLDLDYSGIQAFELYGIDLDPETLSQAKNYAKVKELQGHCHFFERDAWELNLREKFDLIASNGLSIYEHDDQKVIALYRQFFDALKPGGTLVTSFLTPSPIPSLKSEWLLTAFNPQDALLQKIIFADILDAKWQAYRAEETVKNQLSRAGFVEIKIFYDKAHIFPTITASKPKLI